jgi:hypothetical protein
MRRATRTVRTGRATRIDRAVTMRVVASATGVVIRATGVYGAVAIGAAAIAIRAGGTAAIDGRVTMGIIGITT